MPDQQKSEAINPAFFLIGLLPALVFLVNLWVLSNYAIPFDVRPERLAEFHVAREGAARIGVAAAFLLVAGAAGAILLLFSFRLLRLDWKARFWAGVTYVALTVAALVTTGTGAPGAEDYPGRTLFCLAAAYSHEDSVRARAPEGPDLSGAAAGPESPVRGAGTGAGARGEGEPDRPGAGVAVDRLPYWQDAGKTRCSHARFDKARRLAALQFFLVVIAFSGLVVGAVSCLAGPPEADAPAASPSTAPGAAAAGGSASSHWEAQAEWLNKYLYLGAFLLGAALIFIGAFLRWPLYALPSAEGYEDYISSMLAYYGFTFSMMLASFYVPVASFLTLKVKGGPAGPPAERTLPDAFKGPLQLLKIVLGLASTALAGVLPGIIDMIA